MVESVVLEQGALGQVLEDRVASYLRYWWVGDLAGADFVQFYDLMFARLVSWRPRFAITDISLAKGSPSVAILERLTVAIGVCRTFGDFTHFSVTPRVGTARKINTSTFHEQEAEYRIEIIEVGSLEEALQEIARRNLERNATSADPLRADRR